jgi:hypothetical protein
VRVAVTFIVSALQFLILILKNNHNKFIRRLANTQQGSLKLILGCLKILVLEKNIYNTKCFFFLALAIKLLRKDLTIIFSILIRYLYTMESLALNIKRA